MVEISLEVLVALIAAISSVIVSILSALLAKKNERSLEEFKAELQSKQSEENARRDYEYEAKKRLYHEYEPLLFQFHELAESALTRIKALARDARNGKLGKPHPYNLDSGWLSGTDSYYIQSTIYRLSAPLAVFILMQRRLTLFDLNLIPSFRNQYLLAKVIYRSFSHDFRIARIKPAINYEPNFKTEEDIRTYPEMYRRQGLVVGLLDNIANELLTKDGELLRIMSFGEFQTRYFRKDQNTGEVVVLAPFDVFRNIFKDFHPMTHPILWRILIAQAHVYRTILSVNRREEDGLDVLKIITTSIEGEERKEFDWREEFQKQEADKNSFISSNKVLAEPFSAVEQYLKGIVNQVFVIK
jgi:hypothetical protein